MSVSVKVCLGIVIVRDTLAVLGYLGYFLVNWSRAADPKGTMSCRTHENFHPSGGLGWEGGLRGHGHWRAWRLGPWRWLEPKEEGMNRRSFVRLFIRSEGRSFGRTEFLLQPKRMLRTIMILFTPYRSESQQGKTFIIGVNWPPASTKYSLWKPKLFLQILLWSSSVRTLEINESMAERNYECTASTVWSLKMLEGLLISHLVEVIKIIRGV